MNDQPATIPDMKRAIEAIFEKRALAAAQMQYDRRVWINAVSSARGVFERVAPGVTVDAYHQAVVTALAAACEAYNDPDGEYTNGTGAIGDVLYDVMGLRPDASEP